MKNNKDAHQGEGARRKVDDRCMSADIFRRAINDETLKGVRTAYVAVDPTPAGLIKQVALGHPKVQFILTETALGQAAALQGVPKKHANIRVIAPPDPFDDTTIPLPFEIGFVCLPAGARSREIPAGSRAGRYVDAFLFERMVERMPAGGRLVAIGGAGLLFARKLATWRKWIATDLTINGILEISSRFSFGVSIKTILIDITKRAPRPGARVRIESLGGAAGEGKPAEVDQKVLASLDAWSLDMFLAKDSSDSLAFVRSSGGTTLEKVTEEVFIGIYPLPEEKLEGSEGATHILVGIGQLQEGRLVLTGEERRLRIRDGRRARYHEIQPGDLLLTARGSVIKMAVVESVPGKAVFSSNLICIRTGGKYEPGLLRLFLESPVGARLLEGRQRVSRLKVISPKDLLSLPVPVVPPGEQRRLAEQAERAVREYTAAEETARRKRDNAFNEIYSRLGIARSRPAGRDRR